MLWNGTPFTSEDSQPPKLASNWRECACASRRDVIRHSFPCSDFRIPIEIVRARELKWLSMLTNWDYMMAKKFNKIRDRCRKGIPSSMRARAWQYLTNSWREPDEKADLYKANLGFSARTLSIIIRMTFLDQVTEKRLKNRSDSHLNESV